MKKISLLVLICLMLFGCSYLDGKSPKESNMNQENVTSDVQNEQEVTEENNQIILHQYKLFVYNLQDTFYKNSTIWMILDADSNLNSYKAKKFHMDPIIEVQMLQDDKWVSVHHIGVPDVKAEDTEQVEIIFDFELSDFDYVDGTYRLKATVYEKDKYTEVFSEEAEWISTELENEPLESSEYLKLYPFNKYAENKMFTQNRKNVGKSALIRVLPKGCAVIAKEVGYQEIHHVPCEVLNSDGCQFVDAKDVFDVQEPKLFARRFINGYRDEEVTKLGSAVDLSVLLDWLNTSDKTILIPNCFDVSYEFEDSETYLFDAVTGNETLRFSIINIEGTKGSYVQVNRIVDRDEMPLAVMWVSRQMTKAVFVDMLK
ncbi:MAG: hypothetical protein IJ356_06750 [Erysipelotrichaceae bacterium]|nr:hypothetical protein [Erysipelotrichaceae bacterium]